MKILHCIPGMGGGGAERQLAYLAGPLRERGWDVHVALVSDGPNMARLGSSGAVIHRLTPAGNYDPRLAWQLARVMRRVRPALVQVWFTQMEIAAGGVAELLGVPWILSERSSAVGYPPTIKNRMRTVMARTANAIIANSSAGDQYWHDRVDGRVPRYIIPNAVPYDEIGSCGAWLPPGVGVRSDHALVLFAGRFGPEKNVTVLLEALTRVVRARAATVGVLCGDGPLRADVLRRIAADGLSDRLLAPGYVGEVFPLMKRADVVVSVGLYEGHPNAVMEAMAAGRPLVVSDIPAHREILDARSAAFVNASDAAAIAGAVIRTLDDPAGARERAAAAHARAREWSVEACATQYDRAYRAILAAGC